MADIDKNTISIIILSLSNYVIRKVAKLTLITTSMQKLENLYMKKPLVNTLYIRKRMFTLKVVEGSSLDKHIDEFNQVYNTTITIDETLNDEGKVLQLISSLPKSAQTQESCKKMNEILIIKLAKSWL